jgi:hypothetical protein
MRDEARATELPACATDVTGGCGGGNVCRSHNARRAPKEEEAGLLHPEVSNRSPRRPVLEGREFDFPLFTFAG